ncbi:hypothetical protein N8449_06095 [Alphaproteobacteria bacterium]|nr:hypothetical protein [Alphaproteobacteria bacterium]
MKKITILILSVLFTLTTSAFAGGMIGVKYGKGDLEGNAKAYGQYNAQSASKDSDFGAIFAEVNIKESPISVGIEFVPLDANISLDGHQSNVSANVSDYRTLYALAMHDLTKFSVYAKLGYSQADIGKATVNDTQTTYVSQSGELEGMMYGVGIQSQELPFGLVARAEYTLTQFDDISVTTTSNGATAVKKTADGELTTMTISLAKSF